MKSNLFAEKGAKTIKHKLFESKQHIFRVSFISQKITWYDSNFFSNNFFMTLLRSKFRFNIKWGFLWIRDDCMVLGNYLWRTIFFFRSNRIDSVFYFFLQTGKRNFTILFYLAIWFFIPFDFILFCLWFLFFFWIVRIYCNRNKLRIPSQTTEMPKTFRNIQNGTNLTWVLSDDQDGIMNHEKQNADLKAFLLSVIVYFENCTELKF